MRPYGFGSGITLLSYEDAFLPAVLVKDELMAPAGTSPFHVSSFLVTNPNPRLFLHKVALIFEALLRCKYSYDSMTHFRIPSQSNLYSTWLKWVILVWSSIQVMWVFLQCHVYHPSNWWKKNPTPKNGDEWGIVDYCYTMLYQYEWLRGINGPQEARTRRQRSWIQRWSPVGARRWPLWPWCAMNKHGL